MEGYNIIEKLTFEHKNFKYIQINPKRKYFLFKEKFDYVIFADVLEHLKEPKKIMEKISNLTEIMIISIPN